MFKKADEEVKKAKAEGRPPDVRLWGWKVQAVAEFKDGMINGKKVWKAEEIAEVSLETLEQLEASAPGNWNKLERVHAPAKG